MTRLEYEIAEATGIFRDKRFQLVDGELIATTGRKRVHVSTTTLVREWMGKIFPAGFINTAAPIDVATEDNPTNEPEPDLIVLNKPTFSFDQNPGPADLRLVVEISDTSVTFDLVVKAALYARAGIVEYWVVDVPGRRLIVHREPNAGRYQSVIAYAQTESVAPLAAPEREFPVAVVFHV